MESDFVTIQDALAEQFEQKSGPETAQDAPPSVENPVEQPIHKQLKDIESRMGRLTASSQKLQSERQAFAEERKQFAEQQQEYARWKQIIDQAQEDPVAFAELAGFQPDQYANTLIEKGSLSPERRRIMELEKQVREDRAWRSDFETKQQQAAQQDLEETVMSQLQEFGRSAGEKFALVNETGSYNDVMAIIQQHYEETADPDTGKGEILPYETAFQALEDHLDSKLSNLLKLEKIKSRFGTQEPAALTAEAALTSAVAPRKSTSPTISSRTVRPQTGAPKQLSEQERMQKAGEVLLRAMHGRR